MIMAVSALVAKTPNPTEEELKKTVSNVCRCGTYDRVREAVASLSEA
jgi:isoquinoline 1-oxidoreductase alpha subunit